MSFPLSITFSPRQLKYLWLDVDDALQTALGFGFAHLRIGTYWSEVETVSGQYDFSKLQELLETCEKVQQSVVLTVSVKAPRWPEFYWPDSISKHGFKNQETQRKILNFVQHTVSELSKFSCITHWQIENEPFDPSGPENAVIPRDFLQKEVELVQRLDQRPIVLTLWGNTLSSRKNLPQLEQLSDIIGIDLYYRQFMTQILGKSFYSGPQDSDQKIRQIIAQSPKPIWITELQAEPWEKDQAGYFGKNPGSMSPEILQKNLERAVKLGVAEIFLWGFEYWVYRKMKGENRYFTLSLPRPSHLLLKSTLL